MYVTHRGICSLTGLAAAMFLLSTTTRADDLLSSAMTYRAAVPGVAVVSPRGSAISSKKARRRSTIHRPLELTLPRLTFSSAAPSAAIQALRPPGLLEPYEQARLHRFGPSPFQPVSIESQLPRTEPFKEEPFRIGFSQDWNLQWDLLQDASPAAGHRFGLNIGLQRKF